MPDNLEINKREYPSAFSKTAIVICLDGSQKEYLEEASKSNLTPNLDKLISTGENLLVHSAIPSFTNPNNISIVTGQPSSVHGICGNFFYTPETGEEVMMNDPKYMRAPTIFEKLLVLAYILDRSSLLLRPFQVYKKNCHIFHAQNLAAQ